MAAPQNRHWPRDAVAAAQWLDYAAQIQSHADATFGGQGAPNTWEWATGYSGTPTLVYDQVRDGASGCIGQLWICNVDAVMHPTFLKDIQAIG